MRHNLLNFICVFVALLSVSNITPVMKEKERQRGIIDLNARRHDGFRVLIVDDVADQRITIRAMVEKAFRVDNPIVYEASNGWTALSIMERGHRFDLIMLDWQKPIYDGLRVLRTIKDSPELKQIREKTRIIVLTGLVECEAIEKKARELGVADFWRKPARLQDFLRMRTELFAVSVREAQ